MMIMDLHRSPEGYWRFLTRSSSTGLPTPFFATIYVARQNAACFSNQPQAIKQCFCVPLYIALRYNVCTGVGYAWVTNL